MDVQSCTSCGKLFSGKRPGVCPKCKQKDAESLQLVTESLRDEPGQSVEELSENTEVEEKVILKFIREGRIASDAVVGTVACGRCGKPAQSLAVRLCQACSADLQKASMALGGTSGPSMKSGSAQPDPAVGGASSSVPSDDDDGRRIHDAVKDRRK